jgi:indolepyruvate ferredoxin oxidoreductase
VVEKVRQADPRSEQPDSIALAVARNLFKLMAYKDEYEVARLYSGSNFKRNLQSQFEGDYELRFNLAPPLFSKRDAATGHLIKQEFGPWIMKAFAVLAKFRFLRGTALDLFGYTAERKQERADIDEYRAMLEDLLPGLTRDNYASALELAKLTEKLRGFGHVKDRNRDLLALRKTQLLGQFRGERPAHDVHIIEAAQVA